MFRALPVVHDIQRTDALTGAAAAYRRDTLTLGWDERLKARARRRTDGGVEFATALPRGTVLRRGDCFAIDAVSLVVAVVERLEPVFVLRPRTPRDWALFGYQIGNSHQPLMLDEDAMVCADLPGMEQVLTYHGIPFTRERRAFTPVGQLATHQHRLL